MRLVIGRPRGWRKRILQLRRQKLLKLLHLPLVLLELLLVLLLLLLLLLLLFPGDAWRLWHHWDRRCHVREYRRRAILRPTSNGHTSTGATAADHHVHDIGIRHDGPIDDLG